MRIFGHDTRKRHRAGMLGTALAMVMIVVACQDSTAIPNTAAVAGNYVLSTVNDTALPRTLSQSSGYLLQIVSDTLALSAYGSWADLTIYSETSGTQTLPDQSLTAGTFTVSGSTVNFKTYSGESFTGNVSANSLLITGTAKALYVKQ